MSHPIYISTGIYPEQLAHLGLLLVHLAAGVAEVPGEAEVGDLADLVVVHQDVARGEVAVDYLKQRTTRINYPSSHSPYKLHSPFS